MKKKILAVAILSAFLFACDSKDESKNKQETAQVVAKLSLADAKLQVEQRDQKMGDSIQHLFEHAMAQNTPFKRLFWEKSSDNQGVLVFHFNGIYPPLGDLAQDKLFMRLPYDTELVVNEALLKDNIIGEKIIRFRLNEMSVGDDKANDPEAIEIMKRLSQALTIKVQYLPEGKVNNVAHMAPFTFESDGQTIVLEGFNYNENIHEDDASKLVRQSSFSFDFAGAKVPQEKFELYPFKIDGQLDAKGNGGFKSNTIAFKLDEGQFSMQSILGTYHNLRLEPETQLMLGKMGVDFTGIKLKSEVENVDLSIGDLGYEQNIDFNNHHFNIHYGFKADLDGKSLKKEFNIPIEVQSGALQVKIDHLSPELTQRFAAFGHQASTQNVHNGEMDEQFKEILQLLIRDQVSIKAHTDIKSDLGVVNFDASFKLPKEEEVAHFFAGPDREQWAMVFSKFQSQVNLEVSEKILSTFGVLTLAEMQLGQYWTRENGLIKMEIKAQDGSVTINGQDVTHLF